MATRADAPATPISTLGRSRRERRKRRWCQFPVVPVRLAVLMAADMPKINAEALISAVAARPALWQAKHRDNKNKHRKQALWDEVAAAVAPGVADGETVQKKWKSLRDKYRRLFNLMLDAERSGASAEDMPQLQGLVVV
ncbi:uncharacterized protein LOC144169318 isoform X2 [Haemaphysalis longicornis]